MSLVILIYSVEFAFILSYVHLCLIKFVFSAVIYLFLFCNLSSSFWSLILEGYYLLILLYKSPRLIFFPNIFLSCTDLRNPIDLPSSLLTHFSDAWYCTMASIDWLNFWYLFNLYFNCMCMGALPTSGLCTTYMQRLQRGTRMSHTLELEFQVVMGCRACADNQT